MVLYFLTARTSLITKITVKYTPQTFRVVTLPGIKLARRLDPLLSRRPGTCTRGGLGAPEPGFVEETRFQWGRGKIFFVLRHNLRAECEMIIQDRTLIGCLSRSEM